MRELNRSLEVIGLEWELREDQLPTREMLESLLLGPNACERISSDAIKAIALCKCYKCLS